MSVGAELSAGFPAVRLRRLRRTAAIRDLFAMPKPGPEKFIWPVFVVPGAGRREPIDSMPGQFRLSASSRSTRCRGSSASRRTSS